MDDLLPGLVNFGYFRQMAELHRFEAWLREQGLSDSTIRQRMSLAARRQAAWGTLDVSPAVVTEWLSRYHGWTRRTYHNHLASVFRWMVETGEVDASPLERVRPARCPHPRPTPLSAAEVALVMAVAEGPVRTWIMLGLFAGLRRFEMAKFSGEDITEQALYVFGKGGQAWTLPTHPSLWALAQDYPRTGYWFPSPLIPDHHVSASSVGDRVHKLFASVGVPGSVHRTRATFGTSLLRGGANIRVVQQLLRHSSLTSTAHYLGVDGEECRAAIGTLAA